MRQLIVLDNRALVVDTPGMRELGNLEVDEGIDETFDEIAELAEQCRFGDCTHTREKGCAVLAAVEEGTIPEERYNNYIKLKKESEYNKMTYYEKRQKDKKFGKMIKTFLKHKKDKRY